MEQQQAIESTTLRLIENTQDMIQKFRNLLIQHQYEPELLSDADAVRTCLIGNGYGYTAIHPDNLHVVNLHVMDDMGFNNTYHFLVCGTEDTLIDLVGDPISRTGQIEEVPLFSNFLSAVYAHKDEGIALLSADPAAPFNVINEFNQIPANLDNGTSESEMETDQSSTITPAAEYVFEAFFKAPLLQANCQLPIEEGEKINYGKLDDMINICEIEPGVDLDAMEEQFQLENQAANQQLEQIIICNGNEVHVQNLSNFYADVRMDSESESELELEPPQYER